MKSYQLEDYADGPPVTSKEIRDQAFLVAAEKVCQTFQDVVLKPCPFCDSSNVHVRFYNQPSVVCEDCLCMGPASERMTRDNKDLCEDQAKLLWNNRK